MFRALYLTFHGSFRGGEAAAQHIHESPTSMTFPLIVLGVLSTVGGFVGFPGQLFHIDGLNLMQRFLDPVILPLGPPAHVVAAETHAAEAHLNLGTEWLLVAASVAAAAAGLVVSRSWYLGRRAFEIPQRLATRLPFFYGLLLNKYWIDELYDLVIVRPLVAVSRFCWRVIDELGIDTVLVNGSAFFVELTGDLLRFTTTGNVRHYALSLLAAIIGLAALLW
jgi:NADH-quinone oxidoreductase subunit L